MPHTVIRPHGTSSYNKVYSIYNEIAKTYFLRNRSQYTPLDKRLFGLFADSCPDRWGRVLMKRKDVPEFKLETFSKTGITFLVKRFDRNGHRRKHFSSAMTMLGKTDGASGDDGSGYLDIAAFLRSHGASPTEDLQEL